MGKEKILVSACFVKEGYKYSGGANINQKILELSEKYEFVYICPEVFGGLTVPRLPSEIVGDKVLNSIGEDVTEAFITGAMKSLAIAKENGCTKAILKGRSPSCGKGFIYDGTFAHNIIEGNGIAAQLLMQNGITVYTEEELNQL